MRCSSPGAGAVRHSCHGVHVVAQYGQVQVAAEGGADPQTALMQAGLAVPAGAVQWLTPPQRACIADMLAAMEEARSFESTAWVVSDCLLRAQRANSRTPDL